MVFFVCKTYKIELYFKLLVLLKRNSLLVFYNSKIIALAAIFLQYFGLGYRKSILIALYNINKSLNIFVILIVKINALYILFY